MTSLVIPNPDRPFSDITLLEAFVDCPYEAAKFEDSCMWNDNKEYKAATVAELEKSAGYKIFHYLSCAADSHFIRAVFYYFCDIMQGIPPSERELICRAIYNMHRTGRTVADAITFAQEITAESCPERQEQVARRMQRNLTKFAARGKEFPSKSYCGVLNI